MDELLATTMQHAREAIESQIRIESPLMDWLKAHPGYRLPWHPAHALPLAVPVLQALAHAVL